MSCSRITVPKDLIIRLERIMCPGACPDYSVTIHSDGKVVYVGRHYVAIKGIKKGRISTNQVEKLIEEFYRIDYFSLKERYDAIANDGAITRTFIRADGKSKQVINCHPSQAPEDLYNLEKKIDETVRSEKWIRGGNGQPVLER